MVPLLLLALSASPDGGVAPARGAFSRSAVHRVVRQHAADLRACGSYGEITLTFVVEPDGRVSNVTTESMTITDSPDVLSCVIHALRSWSFPSPGKKAATVKEYRFVLAPAPARKN